MTLSKTDIDVLRSKVTEIFDAFMIEVMKDIAKDPKYFACKVADNDGRIICDILSRETQVLAEAYVQLRDVTDKISGIIERKNDIRPF